jgi:Secretion system C-terminal sorting domain
MKRFLTPLIMAFIALPSLIKAQCSVEINSPALAISNCTGPQLGYMGTGSGPFTQVWSSTGPITFMPSTTSIDPYVQASSPGTYVVTVIMMDGMGCTAIDSDTIQFIAPVDSFYVSLCPLPDTICPLDITMGSFLGWQFVDSLGGTTSLTPAALNCVNVTQEGTYRLMAVYETACTVIHDYIVTDCSTSCSLDAGPDQLYCYGTTYPLNAVVSPAGAGWTYSWSNPLFLSSTTIANPLFFSVVPGTYEYIITATNTITGCVAVDTLTITLFDFIATFDVYSCTFPYTLCPIAESILTTPLSWNPIGTGGLVGNCNMIDSAGMYTFTGIYSGTCTVIHNYNVVDTCASSGPCSVDLGPDILAISNCMGPDLESTASGSGSFTYSWTGSANVTFLSPTAANTIVSAAGPGVETITLTVTDSLGCVASDNMNITFYHPTDTFYSYTCGFPDSLCILDIDIPFGNPAWSFIDSLGGTTPVGNTDCIAATQNGTYQMFAIYETNCTVIHKYIVFDTCFTSVYEHASLVEAGLYPNPASDQVTIITDEPLTNLVIWDATGRQVMTKVNYQQSNKFTFSIGNLLNGSYLMRIETAKGFVNKRLVKINK